MVVVVKYAKTSFHKYVKYNSNGDKLQRVFKVMQRNRSNKFPWQVFMTTHKQISCGTVAIATTARATLFQKILGSIFLPSPYSSFHYFSRIFGIFVNSFSACVLLPPENIGSKFLTLWKCDGARRLCALHRNFPKQFIFNEAYNYRYLNQTTVIELLTCFDACDSIAEIEFHEETHTQATTLYP